MQNITTTKNLIIAVRPFNTVANPVSPSADEYNPVLPNNLHDPAQNDRKWQPMEKTTNIQGEFEMIATQW